MPTSFTCCCLSLHCFPVTASCWYRHILLSEFPHSNGRKLMIANDFEHLLFVGALKVSPSGNYLFMAFAYFFHDDYSTCWFLQKLPSSARYSCLIHVRQWKYFLPNYHLSVNFINVVSCWTAIFTLTKLNSVFFFMIYASDFFLGSHLSLPMGR